jgi:hypothetical protein
MPKQSGALTASEARHESSVAFFSFVFWAGGRRMAGALPVRRRARALPVRQASR